MENFDCTFRCVGYSCITKKSGKELTEVANTNQVNENIIVAWPWTPNDRLKILKIALD